MCVSTFQVEFVLRELSCFILLPRSRFIGCSGDFPVLKRTVLLFELLPGRKVKKSWLGDLPTCMGWRAVSFMVPSTSGTLVRILLGFEWVFSLHTHWPQAASYLAQPCFFCYAKVWKTNHYGNFNERQVFWIWWFTSSLGLLVTRFSFNMVFSFRAWWRGGGRVI